MSAEKTTNFKILLKVKIRINTDPEDALVYFNNELFPDKIISLEPPGPYTIEVKRNEYISQLKPIDISENDTLFTIELSPKQVIGHREIQFLNFRVPNMILDFPLPPFGEYRIGNALGLGVSFDFHIGSFLKLKKLFLSTTGSIALGSFRFIEQSGGTFESSVYFPIQLSTGLSQKIRFNNAILVFGGGYNFKSMNFDEGPVSNFKLNGYFTSVTLEIPTREHTNMGFELLYNLLSYKNTIINGQLVPLEKEKDASHFSARLYLGILL